jgi:hypothetical protein
MMPQLNLPLYDFRTRIQEGAKQIFDPVRKIFVALTAEEWVRQNFLMYLMEEKRYPPSLIAVETTIRVHGMKRRCDIVIFDRSGKPFMIVECKAPGIGTGQKVFDQIARYNLALGTEYLVVTNGMQHYCCRIDHAARSYDFIREIPACEGGG